jgi:hypothetical protein
MIAHDPLHRTGRAELPHQMCSSTSDALCGLLIYVALSL